MKKQYISPQIELCVLFPADVLTASKDVYTVDDFNPEWLNDAFGE